MNVNEKKMRILFIAPIVSGSITEQRIESLRKNDCKVITFNIQPYYEKLKNPISRRLAYKYNFSYFIHKMNNEIQLMADENTYDIAFISKGITISPITLNYIREKSNLKYVIHYSADPTLITHKTRYFEKCIPIYDLCISTKAYERDLYPQYNPKNVMIIDQGYDDRFVKIAEEENSPNNKYDIVFIGRAEEHYVNAIKSALTVTKSIAIWGPWEKAIADNKDLAPYWKGRSVFGDEYIYKLREGKICLGLLCKKHPDQSTTRTFEIPASGSFLLAERTADHERLFTDKKEAVFFDSYEDLAMKIEYYLENEIERNSITKAGLARCKKSKYSNDYRMKEILDFVKKDLGLN